MTAPGVSTDARNVIKTDGLSVLFLTFNRADLLSETLRAIRPALSEISFAHEIVISDDASDVSNTSVLNALRADQIVRSDVNSGLSHNHNKGIAACRYEFILSLQDDWKFVGTSSVLESAIEILNSDGEIGVINFLAAPLGLQPHEKRRCFNGTEYCVFHNDGMRKRRPAGDRPYQDGPHLKRRRFVNDVGPYREDFPMTAAELDYQQRVACQTSWRVAYIPGPPPFIHIGADRSFNPGNIRARKLDARYRTPIVGPMYRALRGLARTIKGLIVGRLGL